MNKLQTLYVLLGIKHKIQDKSLRMVYLKDHWGLEQADIGMLEGSSQSNVSLRLKEARILHGAAGIENLKMIEFYGEEIKTLMALPTHVLSDVELVAFVNDILGIYPMHAFYDLFTHSTNKRITALFEMGIQNKHLMKVFGKSQAGISMIVKRTPNNVQISRKDRYHLDNKLVLRNERYLAARGVR